MTGDPPQTSESFETREADIASQVERKLNIFINISADKHLVLDSGSPILQFLDLVKGIYLTITNT